MDQVKKCLSPDLHGLLCKFVNRYIEAQETNFEKFGSRFFEEEVQTKKKSPRPLNQTTREAVQMISTDPAALYKVVECDPDILNLRDKLKFLVMGYLINSPDDLGAYGADYFKTTEEIDMADVSISGIRRTGVAASEANDPEKDTIAQVAFFEKSPAELRKLRDKTQHALLFRSLDDNQMHEVLGAMFKLDVPKGSFVIKQGDDGDYFYVVDDGTFEAYVKTGNGVEQKVSTYRGHGSFGELALLYNMPRVATVKAVTNGTLWCLDRDSFRKIVVKSAFKKRKMYEELISSVPMLRDFNDYEKQTLADALQPITFEDGECVIKQSEEATGMYFVEEGTIIFSHVDDSGRVTKLSKIEKGGYFGELALVTKKARAVSAYASGRVRLAFVDKEAFERLLGPYREIMKRNIALYRDQLGKVSKTYCMDTYLLPWKPVKNILPHKILYYKRLVPVSGTALNSSCSELFQKPEPTKWSTHSEIVRLVGST